MFIIPRLKPRALKSPSSLFIQYFSSNRQIIPGVFILGWISTLPKIQHFDESQKPETYSYILGRPWNKPKTNTNNIIGFLLPFLLIINKYSLLSSDLYFLIIDFRPTYQNVYALNYIWNIIYKWNMNCI